MGTDWTALAVGAKGHLPSPFPSRILVHLHALLDSAFRCLADPQWRSEIAWLGAETLELVPSPAGTGIQAPSSSLGHVS